MKTELTMSIDYVPNWGFWEGVRELTQNWIDSKKMGYDGDVSLSQSGVLSFVNKNIIIDRSDIALLGRTNKRNNDALIGMHGDGLKTGLLALTR